MIMIPNNITFSINCQIVFNILIYLYYWQTRSQDLDSNILVRLYLIVDIFGK